MPGWYYHYSRAGHLLEMKFALPISSIQSRINVRVAPVNQTVAQQRFSLDTEKGFLFFHFIDTFRVTGRDKKKRK